MRVLCRKGHFAFYPRNENEVFRFSSFFETTLVRENDFYTFEFLQDAPRYSIKGKPYLGLLAKVTFEGEPWEVMEANGMVYSLALEAVVYKEAITLVINPQNSEGFFLAESPLLQPGSWTYKGEKLQSYDAEYIGDTSQLRVFEVQYE